MNKLWRPRIVVAGAGSVGCYVGGCLALAGGNVRLLLRPWLAEEIAAHGLRITDLEGRDRTLLDGDIKLSTEPDALGEADVILVTVKSAATAEMAGLIARHARPDALVVSLQNGVGNAETLRTRLPGRRVLAGMVPFNVVQLGKGRFHRGTEGGLLVESGASGLLDSLDADGLNTDEHDDMAAVLWGKLLLNLNNALNALSGLPLAQELADRGWRRLLAASIEESLRVLRRAGIRPQRATRLPPAILPLLLRLPDPVFAALARPMLAVDPEARSSMWEDLVKGRPTEIDYLQGAIVRLAQQVGADAPLARRVMALIRAAEERRAGPPRLTPGEVWAG